MNKLNRALLIVALCTVSACVVLALYIMVPPAHASSQAPGESGFPTAQTTETPVTAPSSSPAVPRLLSVYQGQVALFIGDDPVPVEIYDRAVYTLPEEEQQRLEAGIPVDSDAQLASLLEDYG